MAAPGSNFYLNRPAQLLGGAMPTASLPYLSLSGTSMAAPVVAGTVALMLQANPALTPNAVKAILQYTAQNYSGYDVLTEGAGFLNAVGAVRLARFYATAEPGAEVPSSAMWSKQIIWGNHLMTGGYLNPAANAFGLGTTWGVARSESGDNIVWGTACGDGCDNIVWGTRAGGDNIVWGTSGDGDNIVWGTAGRGDNIVWGTACGGGDCDNIVWGTRGGDNIVWGTVRGGDNIVWGTVRGGDNIVWGTSADGDNIVWGTSFDGDNIVWGTADGGDNIVWGTAGGGDNIVWGTSLDGDNIVWGTYAGDDNIVWGTMDNGDNIVWGTYSGDDNIVWGTGDTGAVLFDVTINSPLNWRTLRHVFARLSDEQVFGFIVAMTAPMPAIDVPLAPVADVLPPLTDDLGLLPPVDPIQNPLDLLPPVEPFDPSMLPPVEPLDLSLLPAPVPPVLGGLF